MADGLNKVMLFGNLGADPELRVTPGGQAILKLRIATTESYLDKSNTRQERTEWHSVSVWGKRGEALAKILTKGMKVFVEGGLRTSSYEKEGQKHYRTDIVASNVILGGSGRGAGDYPRDDVAAKPAQSTWKSGGGRPQAEPAGGDFGGGFEGDDDIPF